MEKNKESNLRESVQNDKMIERTSKKYKKQLLLAFLLFLVGLIFSANEKIIGGFLIFGSVIWFLVTKFCICWNHR